MHIQFPDYENSIVNLACSILAHYGIESENPTLPLADAVLSHRYRNIVLILLDGMGYHSVKEHLHKDSFLNKHFLGTYSSTFPPTTVAATTAVESGLCPSQSGWLGWTGYFPELERNMVYFFGFDPDTGEDIGGRDCAKKLRPYINIREKIREKGYGAHYIAPFVEPYPSDFTFFLEEVKLLCEMKGEKFIYAYWDEPDHTMHDEGVHTEHIGEIMREIEEKLSHFVTDLNDTLVLITADHGHINVKQKNLTDYPDLCATLLRMPSIEPRAVNFFIKDGMHDEFCVLFQKYFKDEFLLLSREEVLLRELFGKGMRPEFPSMLGDYLAVGISDTVISNSPCDFLGAHAGLTKEEMTIPLFAIERK